MSRPTIDAAAGVNPLPTGRGVPPPCNPDTLRGPCTGGCGRHLHRHPSKGKPARTCTAGHPVHHSHGRCPRCREHHRYRYRGRRPATHSWCPHDEDEPCDCPNRGTT